MKFKTKRIEKEYQNLPVQGKEILEYADFYSRTKWGIEIVLTEVFRTQAEQDSIYRNASRWEWKDGKKILREYAVKPWSSDHQFWQATDLRTWIYRPNQLKDLMDELNKKFIYNTNDPKKPIVIYHEVNNLGKHFHVCWSKNTCKKESFK